MKNKLFILCSLCILFLSACQDEKISDVNTEEKGLTTFHMGFKLTDLQRTSRSVIDNPSIKMPLWIVVFNEYGFLYEYAKAENLRAGDDGCVDFDIVLHTTDEKRILHFLLNYTDNLVLESDLEEELIGSLYTEEDKCAYWQRIEIEHLHNNEDDIKHLQNIPLIRNCAKITVNNKTDKADNFTLDGFYIVHAANSGSVAPYTKAKFVEYLRQDEPGKYVTLPYSELVANGYIGNMPAHVTFTPMAQSPEWINPEDAAFIYEHTHTSSPTNALSVLIKGKKDGETTYYKISLTNIDKEGLPSFYHVLRNYSYNININKVDGKGKDSPQVAYENPSSNNFSTSVELKDLSSIGYEDASLYVSYVDTTIVDTKPITLKYKYIEKADNGNQFVNKNTDVSFKLTKKTRYEIFENDLTNRNDEGEWGTLTLTPKSSMNSFPITQYLTVYNKKTGLSREITFNMRPTFKMEARCKSMVIEKGVKKDIIVEVIIPSGLNKNLFPAKFIFESQQRNNSKNLQQFISPSNDDKNIKVAFGPSIVDDFEGKKSYHFEKWLTYEEYINAGKQEGGKTEDGRTIIPCHFLTNTENSSSTIYIDSPLFNKAKASFINDKNDILDLMDIPYYGKGLTVKYSVLPLTSEAYSISTKENANVNNYNINLAEGKLWESEFKTTTWGDSYSVTVEGGQNTVTRTSSKRNILAAQVKSIQCEGEDAPEGELPLHTKVYSTKEDAQKYSNKNVIKTLFTADLKKKWNNIQKENLKPDASFWFSFKGKDEIIYYTSMTAEALATHTATLNFEKDLVMSMNFNEDSSHHDYYGKKQQIIIDFTTNKKGSFLITFYDKKKSVGLDTPQKDIMQKYKEVQLKPIKPGTYQVEGETNSWKNDIVITVKSVTEQQESLQISNSKRNKLYIKANVAFAGKEPASNPDFYLFKKESETFNLKISSKRIKLNDLRNGIAINIKEGQTIREDDDLFISNDNFWSPYNSNIFKASDVETGIVNLKFN